MQSTTYNPEYVMAGLLLTTCEPQNHHQLARRLVSMKDNGIDISNIHFYSTKSGPYSVDLGNFISWAEDCGMFLEKQRKQGRYALNSRGVRMLGSMLGKACKRDEEKYSMLLASINV